MAFSRSHLYSEQDCLTSHFCRAISHPARICILRKLAEIGVCIVEDLMESQHLSQPSVSQHLKILREAQLVTWYEAYPYTYYSLHKENFARFLKHFDGLAKTFQSR